MSGARLLVSFLLVEVLLSTHCLANHHLHDQRKTLPQHKPIESRKSSPQHKSLVPPNKGGNKSPVPPGKKAPVPPQDLEKPPHDDHKSPRKGATKSPVGHEPQLPPGRNELPVRKLPPPGKKFSPMPPHKPPMAAF